MPWPELRLDWCSHRAATYAVEHWHYSRSMPSGKTAKLGVWEEGRFMGALVYGAGANRHIGRPYGLLNGAQVCELTRVALSSKHATPVSRLLAITRKMLKKAMPGLRLIVSYADTAQGHYGGIYQASGWLYVGCASYRNMLLIHGVPTHARTIHARWGHLGPARSIQWLRGHVDPNVKLLDSQPKHKYLMPLDDEMSARVTPLAQPYPKRAGSIGVDAPVDQTGEGGSTPTSALQ